MSTLNEPTQSGGLPSVPLQPVVRWFKIGRGSRYHACTRDVFYWAKCGRGGHPHYGPFVNPPEAEKCKECVAQMKRKPNQGADRAAHLVRGTVQPFVGTLNQEEK